jgi:hypothetical protein
MPYTFVTLPFHSSSLSFSPYNDSLLAVTSSQNFGLVGNGRVHVLQLSPKGIKPLNMYVAATGLTRAYTVLIRRKACTIVPGAKCMRINLLWPLETVQ